MSSAEEKIFNEKFEVIQNKIQDYIAKKNFRQVKKYVTELNALEHRHESCNIDGKYAKIANLKDLADEFIFEHESKDISKRKRELIINRIDGIILDINQFANALTTVTEKVPKGIIAQKDNFFNSIEKEERDIVKESSGCDGETKYLVKDLETKFSELKGRFQLWKEACSEIDSQELNEYINENLSFSTRSQSNPRIKLQPLDLPTFKGNVRLFPKFLREFEITVDAQYSDNNTKLMILQNQCLSGAPKELIIHLTSFDEAMKRLKQNFGRASLTIESVIKELKDFKITSNDSINIINLDRFLTSAEDDLKSVNSWDEFNNVVVLKLIESKMSIKNQELWAEKKADIIDEGSNEIMTELKNFIKSRSKIALALQNVGGSAGGKSNDFNVKSVYNVSSVADKKSCFRCGLTNHFVKDCKYPKTVKCRVCKKEGHLDRVCRHAKNKPNSNKNDYVGKADNVSQETDPKTVTNSNIMTNESIRLPFESINTTEGNCLTFWDSGSMINLVSKNWVEKTNLVGKDCNLKYKTVDGSLKTERSKIFNIPLVSKSGEVKIITAYQIESMSASVNRFDEEYLNDFVCNTISIDKLDKSSGFADLLLGIGLINDFPINVNNIGDLAIMSSDYGINEYFICGGHSKSEYSVANVQFVGVTPLHEICDDYKTYDESTFDLVEELGIRPPPVCQNCKSCKICKPAAQYNSVKEMSEHNAIKSKLTYNEDKKCWTAEYPFLKNPNILNDNFNAAFNALKRRETKLIKEGLSCKLYSEQIKDFEKRGVLSKLSTSEKEEWKGPVRYVDHHEIYKEKSTTPLRIVINSSFKKNNELSFNDILMKGPNVLTNILEILVRWRLYPVAFVGDISKMYHNVLTGQTEKHLRRLLWRDCNLEKPPDIYCFNTVTFGDRPAGCIVVSALKATADMFEFMSPKAAEVIQSDAYMDDIVSGADSKTEADILISSVKAIAEKGGFKFKEFDCSGSNKESEEATKILGLQWTTKDDKLRIKIDLNHNKRIKGKRKASVDIEDIPFSKRVCLRLMNGIYDPLGMFAPVMVKLKILMRLHFSESINYKKWDTPLTHKDKIEWIKLLEEVLKLKNISFPRQCIASKYPSTNNKGNYSLICFTDASNEAMCAAVYIRFQAADGESIKVGLVVAKTKLPASKSQTIPRLELYAALLGARLFERTRSAIKFDFHKEYFFVDSKIVLGALSKGSLANSNSSSCIAEIRNRAQNAVFGWVQSKDNIADIGSRGSTCEAVNENSEWQNGPSWLYKKEDNWPAEFVKMQNLPFVLSIQTSESLIDAEKYSDIERLHKTTALCLKFAQSRGTGRKESNNWKDIKLMPEDYQKAEEYWIKDVSRSVVDLYDTGKLQSLRPVKVWDANGQFLKIVTSGRLGELLKIGYDVEELTILDPKHPYTKLVLKECHERDHGGDDRTVWKSREKYWIPQARREVRKIRNNCYRCRLLNKIKSEQIMSPLPSQRVLPTPAWTYTSIDLFGPIEHTDMVRKRMREKSWGVIFTCMSSRAVHLELTQAYHTDALLQALRRFMSVRGAPKEFLSDQGTQLVSCSKAVSGILELLDWHIVDGWCTKRNIKWNFVPPQAHHMNGVAESLIRSTKHLLKQVIEGKRMTFVELQTVLYEVAQILNSRPLGVYSRPGSDPLDGGPITPNHLLLGRASNNIPNLEYNNVSNAKRIKFLQSVVEEFWNKFKIVAFHSLVPQYKWHKSQRNAQIGDVVLVHDDDALVGEYKLGQIVDVKVSKDGMIRTAKVNCVKRTENEISKRILERPIHRLCTIVPVEEQ